MKVLRLIQTVSVRVCSDDNAYQVGPDPLDLDGVTLETVDTFFYLRDTISAEWGGGESSN